MCESYIGEIRMFGGNYAPPNWVLCDGRSLSINEYSPLFSLIGTTYGGDGVSNFNVPDLRGRVPVHMGNGGGLSLRILGQSFGAENVKLTAANLPAHTHTIAAGGAASTNLPAGAYLADAAGFSMYATSATAGAAMEGSEMQASGGVNSPAPFPILMPGLCVNFIIAVNGVFPQRG